MASYLSLRHSPHIDKTPGLSQYTVHKLEDYTYLHNRITKTVAQDCNNNEIINAIDVIDNM